MKIEELNAAKTGAQPHAGSKSAVDTLFDSLTVQAARGLVAAQNVLVAVARWLDGRARIVGDLAMKLSTPSAESPTARTASESASAS